MSRIFNQPLNGAKRLNMGVRRLTTSVANEGRPHSVNVIQKLLRKFQWERWEEPPRASYLSRDFHVLRTDREPT